MDNKPSEELAPIGELFRKAWEIYRGRMWTLIAVGLAAVILPVLALGPFFVLGHFTSQSVPDFQQIIMVGTFLLGMVVAVWLGNWGVSAFLIAIVDQQSSIKEAFIKAKPKVPAHIWLGVLTGLIVMGGYLLLLIPGIIFAVWFFFAPFVFIEEDVRGMDALLKSKAYVRGKWIPVCVRLIAVWLLSALVSLIPFVGPLLALFLVPFSFVYTFLVYQDLKASKGPMTFRPSKKEKIRFVAASAFGFAMPVVLVFAFMGSMFLMPFSMLKAKVTGQSPFPMAMEQGTGNRHFSVEPIGPDANGNVDEDIRILGDMGADWTKRSQAAFRLGQSKSEQAVAPLMTSLNSDAHWMVRQNAVKSLDSLKARQAVPSLIRVLESDKNVFVRSAAAKALGKLGDNRAVGPLKKALSDQGEVTISRDGKNVEVKEVAIAAQEALSRLDTRQKPTDGGAKRVASTSPKGKEKTNKGAKSSVQVATVLSGKETKKYRDMIQTCNKALRIEPNDSLTYQNRAVAQFRLGHYQEAIKDFTEALKRNEKDATAYYNRAIAYGMVGDHEKAIEDGIKAIELNPEDGSAYANRGVDYIAAGKFNEAVNDFNRAVTLNTRDASVYYGRGVAYFKLGSKEKALEDFKTAAKKGSKKAQDYLAARGKPKKS
jgi:tetratricopeptide (TPR) repeat protein